MSIKTVKIRIKDSLTSKELSKQARWVNCVWNYCQEVSYKKWSESRFSTNYKELQNKHYKCGQFVEDSRGRGYLCILIEHDEKIEEAFGEAGIDLGLKTLATLSNGKKYSSNRWYRKQERQLALAQRDKKKKGIKSIHSKIRNRRMEDIHKSTTEIVKQNNLISVGDFKSKVLAKTKMAKSLHDASPGTFKSVLAYKASAHQRVYVEVKENFSSQICSSCETIPSSAPKGMKDLDIREWVCSQCNRQHDRDKNAAMNIFRFERESLGLKGLRNSPSELLAI